MTVERYKDAVSDLLQRRADGVLSQDDEAEAAEKMDDLWRALSEDEHVELETWIETTKAENNPGVVAFPPNKFVREFKTTAGEYAEVCQQGIDQLSPEEDRAIERVHKAFMECFPEKGRPPAQAKLLACVEKYREELREIAATLVEERDVDMATDIFSLSLAPMCAGGWQPPVSE